MNSERSHYEDHKINIEFIYSNSFITFLYVLLLPHILYVFSYLNTMGASHFGLWFFNNFGDGSQRKLKFNASYGRF